MSAVDIRPSEYISNDWASCLQLIGKNRNSRTTSLSLWFQENGLLVRSDQMKKQFPSSALPFIDRWTPIVVDQIQINGKYLFTVSIGDQGMFSEENQNPEELVNVKVFASNQNFSAQPGLIRELVIETGGENITMRCPQYYCFYFPFQWTAVKRLIGRMALASLLVPPALKLGNPCIPKWPLETETKKQVQKIHRNPHAHQVTHTLIP